MIILIKISTVSVFRLPTLISPGQAFRALEQRI